MSRSHAGVGDVLRGVDVAALVSWPEFVLDLLGILVVIVLVTSVAVIMMQRRSQEDEADDS